MTIFSYIPTFTTKHAEILLETSLALLLSELAVFSELCGEVGGFARGSRVVVRRTGVTRGAGSTGSTGVVRGLLLVALVVRGIIVSGVSITGVITGVRRFAFIGRTVLGPSFSDLFGATFPVPVVDRMTVILELEKCVGPACDHECILDPSRKSVIELPKESSFSPTDPYS